MDATPNSGLEQMDHNTCRSICDAVGERLQQNLQPDSPLTPDLARLIDELRRREAGSR